MIKIKLKWWESGEQLTKLKNAAQAWFNQIADWAAWPLQQMDPETCSLSLLKIIAWQRDIVQFTGEPEQQFRLRTQYAYANAKDAGSAIGFMRIFVRMELGDVTIHERVDGLDWDIIELEVTDTAIADNSEYLSWVIQTYGRTCRRYQWKIVTPVQLTNPAFTFNADYGTYFCGTLPGTFSSTGAA